MLKFKCLFPLADVFALQVCCRKPSMADLLAELNEFGSVVFRLRGLVFLISFVAPDVAMYVASMDRQHANNCHRSHNVRV